jgi:DNA-binding CsgD family transcriptional regulator
LNYNSQKVPIFVTGMPHTAAKAQKRPFSSVKQLDMTQQPNTCHITLLAKCLATRITLLCALCLAVCHAMPALAATSDKARQLVRQAANAAVHKDYRQSSALLFKARSEAEAAADYDQLFWVYTNLGINQAELLNYADALQHFTKAYQIATEHLDERRVLSIRNNIAGLYMMNHEQNKALAEYIKIYADIKGSSDSVFTGGCALNIATLLTDKHQYAQARPYMEQAELLLGRYAENRAALVTLRTDYLLGTGNTEGAYRLVADAQTKYPALQHNADILYLRARTALMRALANEAVAQGRLALAQPGIDLSMKRAIFELLSQAYSMQQCYEQALACKDSVVAVSDALSNLTGQKLYEARQIQFDIWQKQQEIDNYKKRHALEMALLVVVLIASGALVWALVVKTKNARQQRKLAHMELEHEQVQREALQQKLANEQAEQEQSRRTIEQRSRELMSKAMQAANRNDSLRELLHTLETDSGLDLDKRPELKRTLAALRHQLDSTVEWKDFTTYFEQTNGQFLQQLKHLHPTLTANELRYLSLVYINLSSKEIALLLNITPEYCKKKKQQVARKMGLTDPRTLYAYLTGSEVMG